MSVPTDGVVGVFGSGTGTASGGGVACPEVSSLFGGSAAGGVTGSLGGACVSEEVKEKLKREHAKLNPLLLKREIEKRITCLYAVQKRYGTHASSR